MSKYVISSSPHLRDNVTTARIMQDVCIALAPAGIAGIVLYGWNAAMLIAVAVATAVAAEWAYQKLTHQQSTIGDWSAVVTGLLLAYNLPANAPWWIAFVGSILAIVLVKQIFGGIGSNFMNPALAARAILFISWSGIMSGYPQSRFALDATSTATPLATLAKGMRVIASGRLQQRSYQAQDGSQRTVTEMLLEEIGPALTRATAQVTRVQAGGGYAGGSTYGDPNRGPAQNGWQNRQPQSPAPAQSQAPASPVEPGVQQGDPWAQTMPATPGSGFGASTDFPSNDSDPEF